MPAAWPSPHDPIEARRVVATARAVDAQARAERLRQLHEAEDQPAPAIRRTAVVAADGAVLREPTAERAAWREPDDTNRFRRTAPLVQGWRRHSVLDRLYRVSCSRSGLLRREHVRAGDRYALDAEEAGGGAATLRYQADVVRVAPGPREGGNPRAASAQRRLAEARAVLGESATTVLDLVVVGNVDVKAVAGRLECPEKVAMGRLVAALDRLVEHYDRRTLRRSVFEESV